MTRGALGAVVLVVFLTGAGSPATAAVPYADGTIRCHTKHQKFPVGSNESFSAWFSTLPFNVDRLNVSPASTTVKDPISVDLTGARTFAGHIGGGGGSRVAYDPARKIIAVCSDYDTASALFVIGGVGRPPFRVTMADLGRVRTKHGIALGSTISDVVRVYGRAKIVTMGPERSFAQYERQTPFSFGTVRFTVSTTFGFARGHVVSIQRMAGI